QKPGPHAVERARPRQRGRLTRTQHALHNARGAALELGGSAARKREQHDPPRIRSAADEVRDAVGERVGLARSRAGNDEQRGYFISVLHGVALIVVERFEVSRRRCARMSARARAGRITKHARLLERTFDGAYHGNYILDRTRKEADNSG